MVGDYETNIDRTTRDQFLYSNSLAHEHLSQEQLDERYIKFKDVTFGEAPRDKWP